MMVKIIDTSALRQQFPYLGGLDSDYSNNDESTDSLDTPSDEQFEKYLEKKGALKKHYTKNKFNSFPISKKRAP